RLDRQVDAPEGAHRLGTEHVLLGQALRANDWCGHQDSRAAACAPLVVPVGVVAGIGRTACPLSSVRMTSYGPATTVSAVVTPVMTSKYSWPAMPTVTGTNTALPSRTTNTPSWSSFRPRP